MVHISVPIVVEGWELVTSTLNKLRTDVEFSDKASADFRNGFMACLDAIVSAFDKMRGETKELVNHPAHYNAPGRKECIEEMIDKWGREQTAIWCEMTAYKYDYRAGTEEGEPDERDMAKLQWYLDKAEELRAEPHGNRLVAASASSDEFTPADTERTAPTWQEKLMKAFLKGAGK